MSGFTGYKMSFKGMLRRRIRDSVESILNYASLEELTELFLLLGKLENDQLHKLNNDEVIISILKEDDELLKRLAQ